MGQLPGLACPCHRCSRIKMKRHEDEAGPDPDIENPEWYGEWERMGQTLKEFSDSSAWEFSHKQIQNPDEVGKYLEEDCNDNSKKKKLSAISWALAYAYRTLLDTVMQQIEAGGQGDKSAATSVTQAAANTPFTQVVAKPDSEPKPLAVATVRKKHKTKTNQPVDNDDPEEGPSKPAPATDSKSEVTIESFSLKDLRGLKKHCTQRLDESLISWLVRIWDAAVMMKWDDREETVFDMAKKLRAYADAVHGPTHAGIAAVETRLQKLEDKIEENPKKLKEEIKEDLLQISAEHSRDFGTKHRCLPNRERRYASQEGSQDLTLVEAKNQIVSPVYLVTCKKHTFQWGPEQEKIFAQIKQEISHVVALGPVRTGPDVKNVLYSAARRHGPSWSLWQKVPGQTRGRPLGFWSQSYRESEANYTPTKKEILTVYEGVQAAIEAIGTEAQLLAL
ncbi:hypothetical protein HGM15179_018360 [Zosterops borbonicus]|uniref:Reverse transcriptase/retrotransposon-derived protein RNase H-like domain-containing protein n=1 Tax=Zosterops borbonicus TaxID=364589 RepID=A0A8K1LC95_9PASS|nr:hypothetical protein HGM15179_018360 [Zosterops borbonicus]